MAVYKPQIKTENGMVDLDIQAERSLKDGNGDTISTTYVKSVNNVTPDANGNVNVSGGGGSPLDAYPVGSIYLSINSTSPASLFGGTWTQIKDVFLLGAGDTYSNGATGGEATHTLTINEIPEIRILTGVNIVGSGVKVINSQTTNASDNTNSILANGQNSGHTDQPHNNMPPYLVVYMWKRTA